MAGPIDAITAGGAAEVFEHVGRRGYARMGAKGRSGGVEGAHTRTKPNLM
jgi:hypothetical protein